MPPDKRPAEKWSNRTKCRSDFFSIYIVLIHLFMFVYLFCCLFFIISVLGHVKLIVRFPGNSLMLKFIKIAREIDEWIFLFFWAMKNKK